MGAWIGRRLQELAALVLIAGVSFALAWAHGDQDGTWLLAVLCLLAVVSIGITSLYAQPTPPAQVPLEGDE